jgi:predicted regulator of Ras-like GTPase activity (Roadblock/LC7/MglB family)
MSRRYLALLDPLTRLVGVRGAMIVSGHDGLVIAETLMEHIKGPALAALAASLTTRVLRLGETVDRGRPRFFQLQARGGSLFVAVAPADLLLVLLAGTETAAGAARVEMLQAVEHMA